MITVQKVKEVKTEELISGKDNDHSDAKNFIRQNQQRYVTTE